MELKQNNVYEGERSLMKLITLQRQNINFSGAFYTMEINKTKEETRYRWCPLLWIT